jgi:uncharacterized protein YneF (UPF0154 family)
MSTGVIVGLVLGIVGALIAGIFIGFFISKKMMKKQMQENPPISREQIKAMYSQMGRKPSEEQINQVMNAYKKNAK